MPTLTPNARGSISSANAIARAAIEAVQKIDAEAKQKKLAHLESLQETKAAIHKRIDELHHQIAQIDAAMASITGTSPPKGKRAHRDWNEARERVVTWMTSRRGQKFAAGDLIREFPELDGAVMSVFLKPLIEEGKVQVDITEGIRRSKYFVVD